MKQILFAALMTVVLATPALAAKLYLKDGGVIQALKVWRSGGKVHVLATRHTETSFEPCEVDLKRTFARQHRTARKPHHAVRQTATATPEGAAASQKTMAGRAGSSLPKPPDIASRKPDSPPAPSGSTIRQHKKEMAERAAE